MFVCKQKPFFLCFAIILLILGARVGMTEPDIVASFSDVEALLDKIPEGRGKIAVTIESFSGKNAKRVSQVADRVEIWLGAKRLASLDASSPEVVEENRRRIFPFEPIELDAGYYFLTVRMYRKGTFSARNKWNGETFQIGIHPGKIARIHKTIPFFVW
ncbi:MAG: hypothetical protein PWR01_3520 [Clostridiales bacterium]|jgi:hypothetical protein|nr:hypothetical protein [Clostridiales bacterium]MDN5282447.1 hypothetical protein [Candidatus Ozemobacter sp.]